MHCGLLNRQALLTGTSSKKLQAFIVELPENEAILCRGFIVLAAQHLGARTDHCSHFVPAEK